jgi:hypothetical protein
MRRFVEGIDRGQATLLPECLADEPFPTGAELVPNHYRLRNLRGRYFAAANSRSVAVGG